MASALTALGHDTSSDKRNPVQLEQMLLSSSE